MDRSYNYAVNTQTIYSEFTLFCKELFDTRILDKWLNVQLMNILKNLKKLFQKGIIQKDPEYMKWQSQFITTSRSLGYLKGNERI